MKAYYCTYYTDDNIDFGLDKLPKNYNNLITRIKTLKLYYNKLTEVPEFVFHFKNLRKLDLSFNRLTKIPESIIELKYLKNLNISNNKLTKIPDFISQLKKLEILNLNNNKITRFPSTFKYLTHLSNLTITNNPLISLHGLSYRQLTSLLNDEFFLLNDEFFQNYELYIPKTVQNLLSTLKNESYNNFTINVNTIIKTINQIYNYYQYSIPESIINYQTLSLSQKNHFHDRYIFEHTFQDRELLNSTLYVPIEVKQMINRYEMEKHSLYFKKHSHQLKIIL